jgi:hypothetical protein
VVSVVIFLRFFGNFTPNFRIRVVRETTDPPWHEATAGKVPMNRHEIFSRDALAAVGKERRPYHTLPTRRTGVRWRVTRGCGPFPSPPMLKIIIDFLCEDCDEPPHSQTKSLRTNQTTTNPKTPEHLSAEALCEGGTRKPNPLRPNPQNNCS